MTCSGAAAAAAAHRSMRLSRGFAKQRRRRNSALFCSDVSESYRTLCVSHAPRPLEKESGAPTADCRLQGPATGGRPAGKLPTICARALCNALELATIAARAGAAQNSAAALARDHVVLLCCGEAKEKSIQVQCKCSARVLRQCAYVARCVLHASKSRCAVRPRTQPRARARVLIN